MGFDVGRVDRSRSIHARRARQGIKDIGPDALTAPAIEAIVDRRVRPVDFRAITPAGPTTQHVDDTADHPAIIDPMRPAAPSRQQRLDPLPLRIAQPINLLRHSSLPNQGKLESHSLAPGNPY